MANTNADVKLDVRAYPIAEPKGNVLAFASITIDELFAVNNIRVINSEKGPFVAMPQARDNHGEFRDICFPVTAELRKQISEAVLNEYSVALDTLVTKRESTVEKLRDAVRAAKERPVAPSPAKAAKNKAEPEL